MRFTRHVAVAAVVAASALVAVPVAAGAASSTTKASNAPIKIMSILPETSSNVTPPFPYGAVGAKARAKAVNKGKGLNGHKVEVTVCDTKNDPNQSAACARRAVDEGAVAVVGTFDPLGAAQIMPILDQAGVPYVGAIAVVPAEYTAKVSFQADGGAIASSLGIQAQAIDAGCKTVVGFSPAGAPSALARAVSGNYAKNNVSYSEVGYTAGQPDLTAVVSEALAKNPDCVTTGGSPGDNLKLLTTIRRTNQDVKYFTNVGSLPPSVLKTAADAAVEVYAVSSVLLPTSKDPLVKQFRADLKSYYGSQSKAEEAYNQFAQDGWSGIKLLEEATAGMPDITREALIAKLQTMCEGVNVGNAYPDAGFCTPLPSAFFTRMFNPWVRYFTVKNGKYVDAQKDWVNIASYVP